MNKKEAENIAWELYGVIECADNIMGVDAACEVANSAMNAVFNIIKNHPKIKREFEIWKNLNRRDIK